ncbi:hypothetical protein, partial [Nocardia wallacei]|uniref:hypothetical protein n=1 Tax=Nocardia wallacei TaxID=480035 RepID=UPI0024579D40
MSAAEELILTVDRGSARPMAVQVADGLRAAAAEGRRPGRGAVGAPPPAPRPGRGPPPPPPAPRPPPHPPAAGA